MDKKFQKNATFLFNFIGGIILFIFGLIVIGKNIFYATEINGYEMVFGLQFITAGVLMVYGKFRGFKNSS